MSLCYHLWGITNPSGCIPGFQHEKCKWNLSRLGQRHQNSSRVSIWHPNGLLCFILHNSGYDFFGFTTDFFLPHYISIGWGWRRTAWRNLWPKIVPCSQIYKRIHCFAHSSGIAWNIFTLWTVNITIRNGPVLWGTLDGFQNWGGLVWNDCVSYEFIKVLLIQFSSVAYIRSCNGFFPSLNFHHFCKEI